MQSDKRPDEGAQFFVRKFLSPRNTQNRGAILLLSDIVCTEGTAHAVARLRASKMGIIGMARSKETIRLWKTIKSLR
jgi:hypothetical protein